jgi:hypothetical protein
VADDVNDDHDDDVNGDHDDDEDGDVAQQVCLLSVLASAA